MNLKEAYSILEIPENTSPEDAKKKYRELTKKYHPDINKDPSAEDKFKKINEAYSRIQSGKNDIQTDQFGRQVINLEPINLQTTISFKESILSTKREFKFTRKCKCSSCNGNGQIKLNNGCDKCKGRGIITKQQSNMIFQSTCDKCFGKTQVQDCSNCFSQGIVDSEVSIDVNIPGGVQNGNVLRLGGMGHFMGSFMMHDQYSDAHLFISVTPDQNLSLSNNDVIFNLNIDLLNAVKGSTQTVPTILGDKEINIPSLSKNKDEIIIPNLGVNKIGNQKVILNISYPNNLLFLLEN